MPVNDGIGTMPCVQQPREAVELTLCDGPREMLVWYIERSTLSYLGPQLLNQLSNRQE